MQSTDKEQLFTEMTAEEAATVNGGGWVTVMKLIWQNRQWVWKAITVWEVGNAINDLFRRK